MGCCNPTPFSVHFSVSFGSLFCVNQPFFCLCPSTLFLTLLSGNVTLGYCSCLIISLCLPGGASGKEPFCWCRRCKRPGSGRSPGGGHGNPLQYSCLENPMDRGAWWAKSIEGCKESDMTERLSMHIYVCVCVCIYMHVCIHVWGRIFHMNT